MNKRNFTILSPRLGSIQTELYRQVFASEGYRVKIIEDTKAGVLTGVQYINQDACYPVFLRRSLNKIGYGDIPVIPLRFFNFEKSPIMKINTRIFSNFFYAYLNI